MSNSNDKPTSQPRRGVVAVCRREERFLVIRRSANVEAPGAYCFPGGGLEPGEDEEQALLREIQEELGCQVGARRHLWRSRTEWNVDLSWWQTELPGSSDFRPNQLEVASVHWLSELEMRELPQLLSSNLAFLHAWRAGEFELH